ncbi:MAG: signal peptidase I [Candidatus Omnitrophota bacterium]|nr:signal peptidase I [Candidatus Omnitrophota bacterium]
MEKVIIKKEVPRFSVVDFKDFVSLILRLKNDTDNPIYKNISEGSQIFISNFNEKDGVDKKIKRCICSDFNKIIRNYELYNQLSVFYGKHKLDSKLSEETKEYASSLECLGKPFVGLKSSEKVKIEWLNLYTLVDLFADGIYNIRRKGTIHAWGEALVVAGALVIFVRTFFFQIYKIPTSSMVPTLMPGDKIFVSKLTYGPKVPFTRLRLPGFEKPQSGEIVVFVPPHERNKFYIKRLIGLPRDHILIKDGNLYINGKKVVDPRIAKNQYYNDGTYAKESKEIAVAEGKYFFLGDNSIQSLDSRFWGFVDESDIVGKAIFIWWPPKRIAMVE